MYDGPQKRLLTTGLALLSIETQKHEGRDNFEILPKIMCKEEEIS